MVQFYPWFNVCFPLFYTHYHTLRYTKTKKKNETTTYICSEEGLTQYSKTNGFKAQDYNKWRICRICPFYAKESNFESAINVIMFLHCSHTDLMNSSELKCI